MTSTLFPWRRPWRLLRDAAYVSTSVPFAVAAFAVVIALLATAGGLAVTFFLALPVAWLLFVASRLAARIERSRLLALTDVSLADPVPPLRSRGFFGRLRERMASKPRWKEIGFHLTFWFVAAVAFGLQYGAWAGSVAMLVLPIVVGAMPDDTAHFWFFDLTSGPGTAAAAAVGLTGVLFVAPWVTMAARHTEVAMSRALLGPTAEQMHAAEVARIESSRTAAVSSAETERRRIERDLHDGAQQRLVALAANLGAARAKLETEPAEAAAMVTDAHEEAKAALREIRDLVRGIHPVILEDRGLDAALSAVAARMPIPVTLDVALTERLPAPVESAAYFVVSEALTNVARHARATRASVAVARTGTRLVVEIHDNGIGGADVERGTGLHGLRDRVAGLGGRLFVISPPGGPTTLSVELPCAS